MTAKPEDPAKKVGEQLTMSVPANRAEFVAHIDRGLRRQLRYEPIDRRAQLETGKGCHKLSRPVRAQGSLRDMRESLEPLLEVDPSLPMAAYDFMRGRWEENAALRKQVDLMDPAIPPLDFPVCVPPTHPRPLLDRRGQYQPGTPAPQRPLRSRMYKLRDGIRPLSQPRVQACGRAIVSESGNVGVTATRDGRIKLGGLAHCGSVWECPTCQMQILQGRGASVSDAVESHGARKVAMLTATIRHGAGDNLKKMRTLLSRTFAAFSRSRAFRAWKERTGVIGRIRATEVTHGLGNGWHPHLHVLFFFDQDVPTSTSIGDGGQRRKTWECPNMGDSDDWEVRQQFNRDGTETPRNLTELWIHYVVKIFGERHRPSKRRALAASLAGDGEYISKMGLELTDPATKTPKEGRDGEARRSPWMIATDWVRQKAVMLAASKRRDAMRGADARCPELVARLMRTLNTNLDARLWRAYAKGMRGAHRLVWSNGLQRLLGVDDLSDAELCEDDEPEASETWIATIPGAAWRTIRDVQIDGEPAPLYLIRAAESGGSEGFQEALMKVAAGEVGAL